MRRTLVFVACGFVIACVIGLVLSGAPDAPAAAPRFDSWKILGPGGGGALFIPTVSPHNPRTLLVGCDMTGSYISYDAGNSWRMFNLRDRSRFFVFDPVDPQTIYAATGGLWRSTDSGRTWALVFPSPASVTGVAMPDDHAGERILTSRGRAPVVRALAVDPSDSKILYAALSDEGDTDLHMSMDSGTSWRRIAGLSRGAHKIYVDPGSPKQDRTLYVIGVNSVSVREAGRWRRGPAPDGVTSFKDVCGGFPGGGAKLVVYAAAPNGLNISQDGGATWRDTNITMIPWGDWAPRLDAVACSLSHPEVAYVSYRNLKRLTATYFGVAKTTDGGRDWKLVRQEARTSAANFKDVWISQRFGRTAEKHGTRSTRRRHRRALTRRPGST
jgi:hypothetical protein